jgi:hypothetical protein
VKFVPGLKSGLNERRFDVIDVDFGGVFVVALAVLDGLKDGGIALVRIHFRPGN